MKAPHSEAHDTKKGISTSATSNWLRAAVLGANDGIVSVAALVVGVAGALTSSAALMATGTAGVVAGSLSMAVGEYVSVSSQRDIEKVQLDRERFQLENYPEEELEELAHLYEEKGLSPTTAKLVAKELTAKDAFAAHADIEHGIDPNDLTNPRHAAFASGLSFMAGGLVPLLAIIIPSAAWRVPVTFAAVFAALILTGVLSARVTGAHPFRATLRVVAGGALAMAITFGIGRLFGVVGL
jgi:VIT1/CCC1 family predicted Fe2+/Mn2+ transporter